ncbi:MAG TPA: S8 family serine peptidase [Candidatus Baltobacteraceae bacterium]|nr:S8 family serine peptidase [Candidatus Baltobacteraceae bacterium]
MLACVLAVSACGGGGGGGGGGITPPTPTPQPTGGTASQFVCPASATAFSVGQNGGVSTAAYRSVSRRTKARRSSQLLTVSYASGASVERSVSQRVGALGGASRSTLHFDRIGRTTRVVAVDPAKIDSTEAALRALPGVTVSRVIRHPVASSPRYISNDPYFKGTNVAPLFESATQDGQWDMHVIGLDYAFGYTQPGATVRDANAMGSTAIRLAIIDTGMDLTHKDLADAHVAKKTCFITDESGVQSTGAFVTDPDGHGTDVTAIAAAATNDGYGFVGAGGNVSLLLYRVFPTPDSACDNLTNSSPTPPQCGATDVDIASAVNDAVSQGADVINLSLGGDPCSGGQDADPTEGDAIANAIGHNVIVFAASGNSAPQTIPVGSPACDPGVIAVGASAYNDGRPNGSGFTGANKEYVTSYTEYGTSNHVGDPASWGIVAPGGDGAANDDQDGLHWIENAWTSTPFEASDAGDCSPSLGETHDCRIFIAGTSQATPHAAGAAALILSVKPSYRSPTAMKQLLCETADDIGAAHQGCGRLNVDRAMAKALGDSTPSLP